MAAVDPSTPLRPPEPEAGQRLDSWKEIAAYLKRDESTVRRWEEEGLPVHRLPHKRKATVYAYKSEIDAWWNKGHARLETAPPPTARRRAPIVWVTTAGLTLVALVSLGFNIGGARDLLLGRTATGEISSIAVLPLRNLSGDPGQDYFADGLTEALITRLGQIGALDVISHQSVLGYRGTAKSLPQIARELNVDALLEGTVLHSGNRVRITANLVQATPERHLWAESYEFDLEDALAIQSDVARDVADRIRGRVTVPGPERLGDMRRVNPEAYL
jgi:TolB-like protein